MTGSGGEKEGIAGDRLRKLDGFQQAHRPVAFLYAVVKKYSDDRGGQLAALIAYYGLVSLFPLLLVLFTVAAYVVPLFPSVQHGLVDSVLAQFPVIGPQLRENVQPLEGNPVALVLGVLTLLWGALGLAQLMQFTMLEVWNIPGRKRPGFVSRLVRSLLLYLSFAIGVSVTTFISSLGKVLDWGRAGSLLAALPGGIATIALFLLVFRILTPSELPGRQLLPGAVVAGTGWQILQTVGINLVSNQLRHASQVYGVFGLTIGLVGFLYLAAQLVVYSAELNVVFAQRLWPRGLLMSNQTAADRRQLVSLARREERARGTRIDVRS